MRRMVTGGMGFRAGWLITHGYGVGRRVRREVVRLISVIARAVQAVSPWRPT
jgi:hypothetical protein